MLLNGINMLTFAVKLGMKHPDPVVETSSLASVEPPDIKYSLSLPEMVIDSGVLSALQLESITYASQQHQTILPSGERAGYLIGRSTLCFYIVSCERVFQRKPLKWGIFTNFSLFQRCCLKHVR
jgi:hypothetical protein